jgi:hypothetical protein
LVAELYSLGAAVLDPHFDQRVRKTHDAKPDLTPLAYTVSLLLQGMQIDALVQNIIQIINAQPDSFHEIVLVEFAFAIYESR